MTFERTRQWLSKARITTGRRAAKLCRALDSAAPVLIFQMGKVGSTSLNDSLARTWPGLTIQTHNFNQDLERNRQSVRLVYERVVRKGGPLFIISPVREPIGRNVSAFFQNFERDTGLTLKESAFSVDELIRMFLANDRQSLPLTWFDTRFKPAFGIDVYNFEFSASGIQIIQQRNVNALLMRCELPDSAKESAVRGFLNLRAFSLSRSNVGSEKPYASAYQRFIEAFRAPEWYLHAMYDSRYFNHFYGASEKYRLIKKWAKDNPENSEPEPRNLTAVSR
jgi:hypothetical protein